MVAEDWRDRGDEAGNLAYFGDAARPGFQATLDFPLGFAITDALAGQNATTSLGRSLAIDTAEEAVGGWHLSFLSNHDNFQSRPWTNYGSAAKVRLAQALQMTLWGTPVVYYGNEIGMEGTNGDDNHMRQPFDWSVMGPGSTYVGSDSAKKSVYDWQVVLDHLRLDRPSLRRGTTTFLAANASVVAYLRRTGGETTLVVLNTAAVAQAPFTLDLGKVQALSALAGTDARTSLAGGTVTVGALGPYAIQIFDVK
jgi:alpha-glucosidase